MNSCFCNLLTKNLKKKTVKEYTCNVNYFKIVKQLLNSSYCFYIIDLSPLIMQVCDKMLHTEAYPVRFPEKTQLLPTNQKAI